MPADQYTVFKSNSDGVIHYYLFPEYEEEWQAGVKTNTVKYYFVNGQRVAESSTANGVRYYIQDQLGSSSVITDAQGGVKLTKAYQPYGSEAYSQGAPGVEYTFTDKERDNGGLMYFGARYYDPEVGRFISVDPARDGLNWYGYCENNPINSFDPTGEKPVTLSSNTIPYYGAYKQLAYTVTTIYTKDQKISTDGSRVTIYTQTTTTRIQDNQAGKEYANFLNTRDSVTKSSVALLIAAGIDYVGSKIGFSDLASKILGYGYAVGSIGSTIVYGGSSIYEAGGTITDTITSTTTTYLDGSISESVQENYTVTDHANRINTSYCPYEDYNYSPSTDDSYDYYNMDSEF